MSVMPIIDTRYEIGKRYNNLTVIKVDSKKQGNTLLNCRCDCGETRIVRELSLIRGKVRNCKHCSLRVVLTGQRYGKLTVTDNFYKKNSEVYWECLCDCGKISNVTTERLRKGITNSCGCLQRVMGRNNNKWKGYEGLSSRYWKNILQHAKTRNLEVSISIEDAWNKFVAQDKICALSGEILVIEPVDIAMERTASLDRIDSKQGYNIANIQWIHKQINVMKMAMAEDKFITWCAKIANYSKNK